MLLSKPKSLAFPAGTISNSAEIKSSSSKSYFSFKSAKIFSLTASFSFPSNGIFPTKTFKSSPAITSFAFFEVVLLINELKDLKFLIQDHYHLLQ